MSDLTPNSVPLLFLCSAKDEEHRVPYHINNRFNKENHPPMRNITVTLYDIPRNVGSHEPHEVGGAVGDPEQSPRIVACHVDVDAHESGVVTPVTAHR